MPAYTRHLALSVAGALRNWRDYRDCLQRDDGSPMPADEAKAELETLHAAGVRVLPCVPRAECPDFDPVTGCPGHPEPPPQPQLEVHLL